jgi:hypothetical protein
MLLSDLLDLFSSQLNIDRLQFNSIVENNAIKLNQKLVLEKKKILKNDIKNDIKNNIKNNITNDIKNDKTSDLRQEPQNFQEKRSRGRPRKQCNVINVPNIIPEDVDYEVVEEITYNDKDYYKTESNVLLDTNYNACGLIVDGLIILKDLKES